MATFGKPVKNTEHSSCKTMKIMYPLDGLPGNVVRRGDQVVHRPPEEGNRNNATRKVRRHQEDTVPKVQRRVAFVDEVELPAKKPALKSR